MKLKTYLIDFKGMYSIGAYAVVYAYNEEHAKKLFEEKVGKEIFNIERLKSKEPNVYVFADGDY